jgi:hypothetical protein
MKEIQNDVLIIGSGAEWQVHPATSARADLDRK